MFCDVNQEAWYEHAVSYVYQNELFNGTSQTSFAPGNEMTREMFVTVLYRLNGQPSVADSSTFTDVTNQNAYYYKAVLWAAEQNIITGYPDGRFGVGYPVTREQMLTMLYRYTLRNDVESLDEFETSVLQQFEDANVIAEGMRDAVIWAVSTGIVQGKTNNTLSPRSMATRAEVAQILFNYGMVK